MSINEEELIRDILSKYSSAISQVYARQIAEGVRKELLNAEQQILEKFDKTLFTTMLKQLTHAIILVVNSAVEKALQERSDIIANQVRMIVMNELKKLRDQIKDEILKSASRTEALPTAARTKEEVMETQMLRLSNELRECRMRLAEVSSKLGTFFNLMLRFEPRFHVIPILEESNQMRIDKLAATLRTPIHRMTEFLRILEEAGIVRIHGNVVKLAYPIFKSLKDKK